MHDVNTYKVRLLLPKNSAPLPQNSFEQALKICDWIELLIRERNDYLNQNHLDAAINNPAGNWSLQDRFIADLENSFVVGCRALLSRKYENINMLRAFSQNFSGCYLGIKNAYGMGAPETLPQDLDTQVIACLAGELTNEPPGWLLQYSALISEFPQLTQLSPPRAFGETGFLFNDIIVNHDTYAYLERIALLYQSGLIQQLQQKLRPVILEIGSGYGALAYYIKKLIPQCVYICLDLPESLIFSAIYLSRYFPNPLLVDADSDLTALAAYECAFVPNYMFHRLVESHVKIDLAINTLSISEMTVNQVSYYCEGLKKLMGTEGKFFEQNQENQHLGPIYSKKLLPGILIRKAQSP